MKITLTISKNVFNRFVKEAKDRNTTVEKLMKKEIDFEYDNLTREDEKGTCHGGWYSGHSPKTPNDGIRTICTKCGKGLVQRQIGWNERWVLDNTKKALHLVGAGSK